MLTRKNVIMDIAFEDVLERIRISLIDITRRDTVKACEEALQRGVPPATVMEALFDGLTIIGEKFEVGEYFLSELIMVGEILKDAQNVIRPHLKLEQIQSSGKVVMGTVAGDLHDIGKNIVISLLEASGFDVIDLDVNVPIHRFVKAVREHEPDVLGLSALLRSTAPEMKKVIEALESEGLRDKVKVIVGGLPLNPEYAMEIGADYYAEDAWKGIEIIREVLKNK
jgi:5-methyltetrahydrofolate--homocysteine methyltransferase